MPASPAGMKSPVGGDLLEQHLGLGNCWSEISSSNTQPRVTSSTPARKSEDVRSVECVVQRGASIRSKQRGCLMREQSVVHVYIRFLVI